MEKQTLPVTAMTTLHSRREKKDEKKGKEVAPTVSEWVALRKLLPQSNGVFSLRIRSIGDNQRKGDHRNLLHAFYCHFAPYNIIPKSIKYSFVNSKQVTFISFASFFTAYCAWKEKDKTICMGNRIGLEPAGGNVNALSDSIYILVTQLPEGLLMSKLVTQFAKFRGLICINPHPREHCAIISYSTLESAQRACTEVTSITVNGNKQPISVKLLDKRPSIYFGTVNCSLPKAVINRPLVQSDKSKSSRRGTSLASVSSSPECLPVTPVDSETKENTESYDKRACGFCISYQQTFKMFQVTCRKKPNTLENVPNEIQFLVTHQIEPIRFWGWLMSSNKESFKRLTEIEKNIASTVIKVKPPHVLPKEGHYGAALYKEGGKETWYRCYVLSSNTETDEVEVFYCDYGNSEVIPKGRFRSTYDDVWTLPPQAVPFKMHGYELIEPLHLSNIKGRSNLVDGQILKATVVKTSLYSQPHIIEIKDVAYVSLKFSTIDKKINCSCCIPIGNTDNCDDVDVYGGDNVDVGDKVDGICDSTHKSECVITADQEVKSRMVSIFDYDEEDLVLGFLSEVHHPNLLYLKLDGESQSAILQMAIDEAELILPSNFDKGNIFLLSTNGQRRRVLALQVFTAFAQVKVLHVDFGVIEWVAVTDLYLLDSDLQDSPFQAKAAALAGIDCKGKIGEAILYLKSKVLFVIKTNVIHESTSGKIYVELFDFKTNKSINNEMIENGLAVCVINEVDTDEELLPNMIPLPELETHVPQAALLPLPERMPPERTEESTEIEVALNTPIKFNSWEEAENSVVSQSHNPFQSDQDYNSELPFLDPSTWLDKSCLQDEMLHNFRSNNKVASNFGSQGRIMNFKNEDQITTIFGNHDQFAQNEIVSEFGVEDQIVGDLLSQDSAVSNFKVDYENGMACNFENGMENEIANENIIPYEHFFQEGDEVIRNNKDETYPPPDIIASNKINNIQIDQGVCIDGRKIRINVDIEVINIDMTNELSMKEVNKIRPKMGIGEGKLKED